MVSCSNKKKTSVARLHIRALQMFDCDKKIWSDFFLHILQIELIEKEVHLKRWQCAKNCDVYWVKKLTKSSLCWLDKYTFSILSICLGRFVVSSNKVSLSRVVTEMHLRRSIQSDLHYYRLPVKGSPSLARVIAHVWRYLDSRNKTWNRHFRIWSLVTNKAMK